MTDKDVDPGVDAPAFEDDLKTAPLDHAVALKAIGEELAVETRLGSQAWERVKRLQEELSEAEGHYRRHLSQAAALGDTIKFLSEGTP